MGVEDGSSGFWICKPTQSQHDTHGRAICIPVPPVIWRATVELTDAPPTCLFHMNSQHKYPELAML